MSATTVVGQYIRQKGLAIKAIAQSTGIPYQKLQTSLKTQSTRELRADEFLKVCMFLEKDPYEFYDDSHIRRAC